jgi:hypothetical protein
VQTSYETWGDLILLGALLDYDGRAPEPKWFRTKVARIKHAGLRHAAEQLRVMCICGRDLGAKMRAATGLLKDAYHENPARAGTVLGLLALSDDVAELVRKFQVRLQDPVFPLPRSLSLLDELDEASPVASAGSPEASLETMAPRAWCSPELLARLATSGPVWPWPSAPPSELADPPAPPRRSLPRRR